MTSKLIVIHGAAQHFRAIGCWLLADYFDRLLYKILNEKAEVDRVNPDGESNRLESDLRKTSEN